MPGAWTTLRGERRFKKEALYKRSIPGSLCCEECLPEKRHDLPSPPSVLFLESVCVCVRARTCYLGSFSPVLRVMAHLHFADEGTEAQRF